MILFLNRLINKVGIDGAIGYTLISRLLQASGGIVTLLFVVSFLNKTEQGYYYTFGSILALQLFFELGLSGIITQYVAHETSGIIWLSSVKFDGDVKAKSRISSLLRFAIRWFPILAVTLFFILLVVGFVFFNTYGGCVDKVEWQVPWILLSFVTAVTLILSPILAFLEGLGKVKDIAKLRFLQQVVQLVATILFFSLGFKLYSAPLALICSLLSVISFLIFSDLRLILISFWKSLAEYKVNYLKEIFPFQWKIALSWISGYFIFQLFNPVLFATDGAIVAGQMGMTITVLNAILGLTLSWITTKVPLFSKLIASQEYEQLDYVFNKALLQSSILNFLGLIIFISIIFILRRSQLEIFGHYFGDRFLTYFPLVCMVIPIFLNHIISCLATYLRCHKQEPMLVQSICIGLLCTVSILFFGKHYGVFGVALGYCIITVLSFIWTLLIFRNKRKEWHSVIS